MESPGFDDTERLLQETIFRSKVQMDTVGDQFVKRQIAIFFQRHRPVVTRSGTSCGSVKQDDSMFDENQNDVVTHTCWGGDLGRNIM